MTSPTVLVIGCGIAGPVVSILLKQKGYNPIIFEKSPNPADVGASLVLFPNGLKVLNLLEGNIVESLLSNSPALQELCEYTGLGQALGRSDIPNDFKKHFGQPAVGVRRTLICSWLRDLAIDKGIEVRNGWSLERIEENENFVTAIFDGNRTETGAFLIGCDGIKAQSRKSLLLRQGKEDGHPTFTGLTQTAGFSPMPSAFRGHVAARNWYGKSMHVICYPITQNCVSWAVTLSEDEGLEASWGLADADQREALKKSLKVMFEESGWDQVVLELVDSAERMIKYGIFDRPELSPDQWFSGRCVMIGDAVHPTSTHLGQGANQACDDCYYLSSFIPAFDGSQPLSTQQLSDIFQAYAEKQQPHTAALTKAARKQGMIRVAPPDACAERDRLVAQMIADRDGLQAKYAFMCSRPF